MDPISGGSLRNCGMRPRNSCAMSLSLFCRCCPRLQGTNFFECQEERRVARCFEDEEAFLKAPCISVEGGTNQAIMVLTQNHCLSPVIHLEREIVHLVLSEIYAVTVCERGEDPYEYK